MLVCNECPYALCTCALTMSSVHCTPTLFGRLGGWIKNKVGRRLSVLRRASAATPSGPAEDSLQTLRVPILAEDDRELEGS